MQTSTDLQSELAALDAQVKQLESTMTEITRQIAESPDIDLSAAQIEYTRAQFALTAATSRRDYLAGQLAVATKSEQVAKLTELLAARFALYGDIDGLEIEIMKARAKLDGLLKSQDDKRRKAVQLTGSARKIADLHRLNSEFNLLNDVYNPIGLDYPRRAEIMQRRLERGALPEKFDYGADQKRHDTYLKLKGQK